MPTKEPNEKNVDYFSLLLCEKMKTLRKKHGWTLEKLAKASGVSRSMLSQIERGNANPTLAVACRIAKAFNTTIGELVEEPWLGSSLKVIRHNDPTHLYRTDSGCQIRTLSPLNTEKTVEFFRLSINPGAKLQSNAHGDGTQEFLTVITGSVNVQSGPNECDLNVGDSAHFRSDLDHVIRNTSSEESVCFLVAIYLQP